MRERVSLIRARLRAHLMVLLSEWRARACVCDHGADVRATAAARYAAKREPGVRPMRTCWSNSAESGGSF